MLSFTPSQEMTSLARIGAVVEEREETEKAMEARAPEKAREEPAMVALLAMDASVLV